MRRLSIIPGLLFGLLFAGGGLFIGAETAWPMWQNWRDAQQWQPATARLSAVHGENNDSRAQYAYDYAGASYLGNRVSLTGFKDNIGAYHRDTQARLRGVLRDGGLLQVWVNPANPAQSVIDRDMRWGLFSLVGAFCSVFVLIGLLVIYASLGNSGKTRGRDRPSLWQMRKAWQQARTDGDTTLPFVEFCEQRYAPAELADSPEGYLPVGWRARKGWEQADIRSDAGKSLWFYWLFCLLWNAISAPLIVALPVEVGNGNHAALIGLLFPLVGLVLAYMAIARSLEYRRFGRVMLHMDPYPGAIGGHVGGYLELARLDFRRASEARDLQVKLECVHSYVSGSGKNRSRRESIKWAEQGQPKIEHAAQGARFVFRFDVPAGLPRADVEQHGAYHFWRLSVKADIPGIDLRRSYNIPVFATAAQSSASDHDISAQVASRRQQRSDAARIAIGSGNFDIEGLSRALRFSNEGDRILLRYPMFRNKALTLFAAVFAGGFGFACYSMANMASEGGLFGAFIVVFAIPFFLVALVASIATLYLPFNNLRVVIRHGEAMVLRRWLFIPLYLRRLQRGDIRHLEIKRSGSTGQGVDKTEHFKIRAEDANGRKVTLAEDIDGADVAGHFRNYLAQRLGVAVKQD